VLPFALSKGGTEEFPRGENHHSWDREWCHKTQICSQ
jgi:hypothetical protein